MSEHTWRVGLGDDTHRLVEGRPLWLGGVEIPHDRGLDGHSDADVVSHAVADALLGAAGLGDIGEHFPDTDPAWKGIAGLDLLGRVVGTVQAVGWSVVNCDLIIHAQRPKLSPYKATIRSNLADALGVPITAINIKAKTGERVGPVGRMEAMAAQAVVLLQRTTASEVSSN